MSFYVKKKKEEETFTLRKLDIMEDLHLSVHFLLCLVWF